MLKKKGNHHQWHAERKNRQQHAGPKPPSHQVTTSTFKLVELGLGFPDHGRSLRVIMEPERNDFSANPTSMFFRVSDENFSRNLGSAISSGIRIVLGTKQCLSFVQKR